MKLTQSDHPVPRYSVALLSASALAYEVLLMRLFSIIQWHHFAYMIISLALLGYGISGTFLALTGSWLRKHFALVYVINISLFALSALGSFLLTQSLPFNPQALFWQPWQSLYLLLIYLLLALPFFFAANAIGLALFTHRQQIAQIYAADMMGAGLGSLAIIGLLFLLMPPDSLLALCLFGLLGALLACHETGLGRSAKLGIIALSLFLLLLPASWLDLKLSPYKGLSQALQISGSRVISEVSSPLGLLSVVENPVIPLRHAPGLSLKASTEPPPQIGMFYDGENMSVITEDLGDKQRFAYLDQLTSALPYHLNHPRQVLVLGAGGGSAVLQAKYQGVSSIDAVELNPQVVKLLQHQYRNFSGHLYNNDQVQIHIAEARGFIRSSKDSYDLIQLSLLDSYSAAAAGLYALSETYLYTTEALQDYLARLNDNGLIAITRWLRLPPRDSLKLFATAIEALEKDGVKNAGQQLILIRSWQTTTLLMKNGLFSDTEIETLKRFCQRRLFDLAYYPGIQAHETNQYNLLQQPYLYQAATALLGPQRERYLADYKFNLKPASDDRPYFFNFFKWRGLPELLSLSGRGGMALLEFAYLLLIATLLQALLVSVVLILLPLFIWKGRELKPGSGYWLPFGYFLCLGLAFLFVEIAFIQRFILFLHHPLYAIAVVLASFLLFAGLGSGWCGRFVRAKQQSTTIIWSILAIVSLALLYLFILEPLFARLLSLPVAIKIPICVVLIAPLAFCMGMPFPLGLQLLGETEETLLPWVWGVNGCASVLSAILATLLAIHLGFTLVILLALLIYATAGLLLRAQYRDKTAPT